MTLESEICNFADDNTMFACGNTIQEIVIKFKTALDRQLVWFSKQGMIVNPEKFQIMFLDLTDQRHLPLDIERKRLPAIDIVKLLGYRLIKSSNLINTYMKSIQRLIRKSALLQG